MNKKPKVLFLDIETMPILASVWGLWDNNVPLNMIERDWSVIAWAAKWQGQSKIYYKDNRKSKDLENDKELLKDIWKLMDEADIIIGQNSNKFDLKKLNARFILNGMKPPSSYKKIDTLVLAKRYFAFTSNKLEYLSKNLFPKNAKSSHKQFPGFDLWKECLKGNIKAWNEMRSYNKQDVIALENLYNKLAPWDSSAPNFNLYHNDFHNKCNCGSVNLKKNGFKYKQFGKYQRYSCHDCGKEWADSKNLLIKEKRQSLKRN
jgi:hypothetical protein